MKIIVGIGNPGKEYTNTRHNVGFSILDSYLGNIKWSKKHNSNIYMNDKALFIKPLTFVNLSGLEVSYFARYYDVLPADIMVIHDDVALEMGSIRIKSNSSSGGHNGVKSIIQELGTQEFIQLKIGVSKSSDTILKDYVLGKLSKQDIDIYKRILPNIFQVLDEYINGENIEKIMNKYN